VDLTHWQSGRRGATRQSFERPFRHHGSSKRGTHSAGAAEGTGRERIAGRSGTVLNCRERQAPPQCAAAPGWNAPCLTATRQTDFQIHSRM